VPKFEPTDIVPLVNVAFSKSFGKQKNAQKAIASRGWNPLNYNILTKLPAHEIVDLTAADCAQMNSNSSTSTSTTSTNVALNINIRTGSGSFYLDKLIEEEKKGEGRKRKFEALKREQQTNEQKISHLKSLTKVSSAVLAANNHYSLDENVLDIVLQKEAADDAARKAIKERKKAAELKRSETLKKALEKFALCPNGLTVPDLKVLVVAATNASESPVKNKKAELQEQLYREPRYSRIQAMSDNLQLTLNNEATADAAAALLLVAQPPDVATAVNLTVV
jgi:hypothetical protein